METELFCAFRIPRKMGECLYYETADTMYPVFIPEYNGFSFIQFQRLEKNCCCCNRAARKTRIVTNEGRICPEHAILRCNRAARKTRIVTTAISTDTVAFIRSCNRAARKTRIVTHRLLLLTFFAPWVAIELPEKQGL